MAVQTAERAFYVKALGSDECQCGREKKPGLALCYRCFKSLPREMQQALYSPLGAGFEEAYEKAVKWLG